jgi:hypothetical protein
VQLKNEEVQPMIQTTDCNQPKGPLTVTEDWATEDTSAHQDHVIAHVIGATILGYFVFDEALYVLLDIGFLWSILLNGEMGLLPHPVAMSELEIDETARSQIKADIDLLLNGSEALEGVVRLKLPPAACVIEAVDFFATGDLRRLLISGEAANLAIETSLSTGEIKIYDYGKST